MVPPMGLEPMTQRLLTTTIFIAITVCGLDFIFTLSKDLGSSCKVSTHGFPCSVLPFYRFHRLSELFTYKFLYKAPIESLQLYQLSYDGILAGLPGLEPRLKAPKTFVLPLHQRPIWLLLKDSNLDSTASETVALPIKLSRKF